MKKKLKGSEDVSKRREMGKSVESWNFNLRMKSFLKQATQSNRTEKMTAFDEFLLLDLVKQISHYAPWIYNWNRDSHYNQIYLRAFWESHKIEEKELNYDHLSFFSSLELFSNANEMEIYDIGGGLGFWGTVASRKFPLAVNYIVEKNPEMVNEVLALAGEFPHISNTGVRIQLPYLTNPYKKLLIMGSFLHLFDADEAIKYLRDLKHRVDGYEYSVVVIEPASESSPLLGYQIADQMLVMLGKVSCYNTIHEILDSVFGGEILRTKVKEYNIYTINRRNNE